MVSVPMYRSAISDWCKHQMGREYYRCLATARISHGSKNTHRRHVALTTATQTTGRPGNVELHVLYGVKINIHVQHSHRHIEAPHQLYT